MNKNNKMIQDEINSQDNKLKIKHIFNILLQEKHLDNFKNQVKRHVKTEVSEWSTQNIQNPKRI